MSSTTPSSIAGPQPATSTTPTAPTPAAPTPTAPTSTAPTSNALQFYFDPACPWTWITSRWVVEVAGLRDLQITWQLFSLSYHNKDNPGYDWIR
jgi:hypothetical protein